MKVSDYPGVYRRIAPTRLFEYIERVLTRIEIPQQDARITAHVLTDADLTGRHTHGVSRLPLYVERIESHLIATRPQVVWKGTQPTIAHLNGNNGLGPVIAWYATEKVIAMAKEGGIGVVSVSQSNHCGAMSVYCTEVARHGLIGVALTNTPPGIAPLGGRAPFLGTNPIAFGFPRHTGDPPLIIDLSTSVVARGHIIQAARLGKAIPEGWAVDQNGHSTTDAMAALKGAVLPMGGAKGYALALSVEILAGVLSGSGVGPSVKNPYADTSGPSNVGHFFLALNPSTILDTEEFYTRLESLENGLRDVVPIAEVPVTLPGDRSEANRQQYLADGIPLDATLIDQLNALAERLDVPGLSD